MIKKIQVRKRKKIKLIRLIRQTRNTGCETRITK